MRDIVTKLRSYNSTSGYASTMREAANEITRLREDVEKYKKDDKQLRIMLAVSYGGPLLYSDDGELQDNRMLPCIDFVRDTPETISKKFTERLRAELLELK